jgi:hypothetical protein
MELKTLSEIERIETLIENTKRELIELERRKKTRSVIYSSHYHKSVSNRLTWAYKYLDKLKGVNENE